jgi:hypothetical protein
MSASPKCRAGVIEQTYHQSPEGEPVSWESRFGYWLHSGEEPYARNRIALGTELLDLDLGWVPHPSMLCIRNEGKDHTVLLCCGIVPFALIDPGRSVRFRPAGPLQLRSLGGPTKISLLAVPS